MSIMTRAILMVALAPSVVVDGCVWRLWFVVTAWSSLVVGDEGCIGTSRKVFCLC